MPSQVPLGNLRAGGGAPKNAYLIQLPGHGEKLIVVLIGANGQPCLWRVNNRPLLLRRLSGQLAINIKPLHNAVINAGDVIPPTRLKGPIRRQVSQGLVPRRVDRETKPILAVAKQPAFLVCAVVLQRPDNAAPLHRFTDAHPSLQGQLVLG